MPNDEIQKKHDFLVRELQWNFPVFVSRNSDLKKRLRQLDKLESQGAILRGYHCPLDLRRTG